MSVAFAITVIFGNGEIFLGRVHEPTVVKS